MAFSKKTWLDRIAEYPTRRRLKKSDGTDEIVSVSREEGAISQEGDAFSAANMNDLEDRVASEFNSLNLKMDSANTNISKKQDSSTAINTSNIGSQSVNYANNANYANSAGSANAATKAYQDGNGADIASTYLKGTQNNGDFINRPSVNISGTICGLIPTYQQNSKGYPVVGLYIQPGTERLIIDWYADGNIIKSYVVTGRV